MRGSCSAQRPTPHYLAFLIMPLQIIAQEENVGSIGTDRPIQSETPTVVPRHYIQMETGIYSEQGLDFSAENKTRTDLLAYNLLLKYGIINNLELRLNFDYFDYETTDRNFDPEEVHSIGGVNAPNIGMKYAIFTQEEGSGQ